MPRRDGFVPPPDSANFSTTPEDEIADLKRDFSLLEKAREEARKKSERIASYNAKLRAKNARLAAENKELAAVNEIRTSAVRYAKVFLWLVPLVCLLLFVSSVFFQEAALEGYTQAVLVVTPVAFAGAVFGFLFRGVFGRPEGNADSSLSEKAAAITNALDSG